MFSGWKYPKNTLILKMEALRATLDTFTNYTRRSNHWNLINFKECTVFIHVRIQNLVSRHKCISDLHALKTIYFSTADVQVLACVGCITRYMSQKTYGFRGTKLYVFRRVAYRLVQLGLNWGGSVMQYTEDVLLCKRDTCNATFGWSIVHRTEILHMPSLWLSQLISPCDKGPYYC